MLDSQTFLLQGGVPCFSWGQLAGVICNGAPYNLFLVLQDPPEGDFGRVHRDFAQEQQGELRIEQAK